MDIVRSVIVALLVELSVLLGGLILFELVSPFAALTFAVLSIALAVWTLVVQTNPMRLQFARWLFIGATILLVWTGARIWLPT